MESHDAGGVVPLDAEKSVVWIVTPFFIWERKDIVQWGREIDDVCEDVVKILHD